MGLWPKVPSLAHFRGRQTAKGIALTDIEEQRGIPKGQAPGKVGEANNAATPSAVKDDEAPKDPDKVKVEHQPPRCCFVCFNSQSYGQYALMVGVEVHEEEFEIQLQPVFGFGSSSKAAFLQRDSDTVVFTKLKEAYMNSQPRWKRYLPFYGVVRVCEVNMYLLQKPQLNKRIPVHILPIDLDRIQEKVKAEISDAQSAVQSWFRNDSTEENEFEENAFSSEQYAIEQGFNSEQYATEQDRLHDLREHRKRLHLLYKLTDYARDPERASEYRTLEGMAQDTPIYNISGHFWNSGEVRALEYVIGWQWDLIKKKLPLRATWMWLFIAVIWLCAMAWGRKGGDWSTAMAFGQLIAASVTLLFLYARD